MIALWSCDWLVGKRVGVVVELLGVRLWLEGAKNRWQVTPRV